MGRDLAQAVPVPPLQPPLAVLDRRPGANVEHDRLVAANLHPPDCLRLVSEICSPAHPPSTHILPDMEVCPSG